MINATLMGRARRGNLKNLSFTTVGGEVVGGVGVGAGGRLLVWAGVAEVVTAGTAPGLLAAVLGTAVGALVCGLAGATVAGFGLVIGVPAGGFGFGAVVLATELFSCRPQLPQNFASGLVGCWQNGQIISLAITI